MSTAHPGWRDAAAYGLLGAPLAMAALPLFVQLPAYYATHVGIALAPLGALLFGARLFDMLQDPILGHLLDRAGPRRRRWLLPAALLLAAAFTALWLPPASVAASWWLPLMLIVAYGAHSLLNIAYLAWGAQLNGKIAVNAVAWREGMGLAGMLLASVIPAAILSAPATTIRPSLTAYSAAFAALLLVALATLLRRAPAPAPAAAAVTPTPAAPSHAPPPPSPPVLMPAALATPHHASSPANAPHRVAASASASLAADSPAPDWRHTLRELRRNHAVRALLLPYLLNALSVAIPATLALFFIADQLQAAHLGGAFLACYFGAAACGLPAWTALTRRYGAHQSWRLGMLLSVLGFAAASLLGPGDTLPYFAVCIAAGAALGADLTLPPLLLAQALGPRAAASAGAAFGIFTLLGKLALALAGLALPLLAWLGYTPGPSRAAADSLGTEGDASLTLVYAVLPCLLKLLALAALSHRPPPQPATPRSPT